MQSGQFTVPYWKDLLMASPLYPLVHLWWLPRRLDRVLPDFDIEATSTTGRQPFAAVIGRLDLAIGELS